MFTLSAHRMGACCEGWGSPQFWAPLDQLLSLFPPHFPPNTFTPFWANKSSQPYNSFFQPPNQEDYNMLFLEYGIIVWLRALALESHIWILVLAVLWTHDLTAPHFFFSSVRRGLWWGLPHRVLWFRVLMYIKCFVKGQENPQCRSLLY